MRNGGYRKDSEHEENEDVRPEHDRAIVVYLRASQQMERVGGHVGSERDGVKTAAGQSQIIRHFMSAACFCD